MHWRRTYSSDIVSLVSGFLRWSIYLTIWEYQRFKCSKRPLTYTTDVIVLCRNKSKTNEKKERKNLEKKNKNKKGSYACHHLSFNKKKKIINHRIDSHWETQVCEIVFCYFHDDVTGTAHFETGKLFWNGAHIFHNKFLLRSLFKGCCA